MSEVYLFGSPVAHSLSPALQNAAFRALALPHRYSLRDVPAAALAAAVERLKHEDALGANVTIPHKESAARLVDSLEGDARATAAVNTIIRRGSRLVGENTDVEGFDRALGASIAAGHALVLGAGGGARACVLALLRRGFQVDVASRTGRRAEDLARAIQVDGRRARAVDWPRPAARLRHDLVVNATPLGLAGEDPLAGMALPAAIVDIVPTREQTPLVRRARGSQDVLVVDGLAMLLHQAARSFELWTGMPAPLEAMRAALPRPV